MRVRSRLEVLVCFFITGAVGLLYIQLGWQDYLILRQYSIMRSSAQDDCACGYINQEAAMQLR